jgi:acetyl esterase/lipase
MKKGMTYQIASIAVLLVLIAGGCVSLKRMTNIDRSTSDYQNRKIDFWNGSVPFKRQGKIEYTDMKFVRYLMGNEYEEQVPYMLDYSLKGPTSQPAMIICPGGSYAFRSEKIEGTEIAGWLNSIGISAFVLNYRVEPYKHPVPITDATQAIKFLRAHAAMYKINPKKIGVIGFSAGGHLAATLATNNDLENHTNISDQQSNRPDVLILCYPVITLSGEHAHHGVIKKLLGENPTDSLLNSLSSQNLVTPQTPPTFIWTTKNDNMLDYQNSELFAEALKKNGVEYEYHLFPKGRHGQGLAKGKGIGQWTTLCENWLKKINFISN